jgi:hypothetical protein
LSRRARSAWVSISGASGWCSTSSRPCRYWPTTSSQGVRAGRGQGGAALMPVGTPQQQQLVHTHQSALSPPTQCRRRRRHGGLASSVERESIRRQRGSRSNMTGC